MSEGDLDRVRADLVAMRQALGLRPPFGPVHVGASLALAAVGVAVVALTAVTDVAEKPARAGSAAHWLYVALIVVPALLALAATGAIARRRRAAAPLAWGEFRAAGIAAAVAVPLYLAFVALAARGGISPGAVTAATLFLAGLFMLTGAIADRSRWHTLGWAVATLLAGACVPAARYEDAGFVAGGWLILGGLSTAALLARQLRGGSDHATD
jgi:hypothetical protein